MWVCVLSDSTNFCILPSLSPSLLFLHSLPPPSLLFPFPPLSLPLFLSLSLSLSSPQAAEKEAKLKEEKKQHKKSEKAERRTAAKQDHGGKWQQDAEGRDGGRREGGRGRRRGSGGRGEEGRGEGGEGKGRKRAKAVHVFFDDGEEEDETPAKKQRGE